MNLRNKNLPLVSIIIPVLNEENHIKNCLEDILNQDYPQNKIEVFIIDGGSKDNSKNIIRKFIKNRPSFKGILLNEPGKNIAATINIGFKKTKGDVIIKVDVHTKYESDYASKCIEYLNKTGADCVGGPLRAKGTDYISQAISYAHRSTFGSGGGKVHQENYEGYADAVYLGAFKKEIFDKIGNWDEEIRIKGAEDDDFNLRIKKNGGKIYLTPEIKSYYYVRHTLKKLWIQYFKYGYSKVFFMKKHRILGAWHHIVPSAFILSLVGSFLLGFIFWPFQALFILILVTYLSISFLVSAKISLKKGLKYFPVLPLVFATFHFSYGIGSLKGIFNAFLTKK